MLQLSPSIKGIIVILLAGIALLGALDYYQLANASNKEAQDDYLIATQETRFAPLAAAVSKSETLGYVSDLPADTVAAKAAFYSAQYALAPRLLVPADKAVPTASIVGNFSKPPDLATLGFKATQDFGNGVMLLQKGPR